MHRRLSLCLGALLVSCVRVQSSDGESRGDSLDHFSLRRGYCVVRARNIAESQGSGNPAERSVGHSGKSSGTALEGDERGRHEPTLFRARFGGGGTDTGGIRQSGQGCLHENTRRRDARVGYPGIQVVRRLKVCDGTRPWTVREIKPPLPTRRNFSKIDTLRGYNPPPGLRRSSSNLGLPNAGDPRWWRSMGWELEAGRDSSINAERGSWGDRQKRC